MEAEPIRWRADELLAQAEWLGALARRLVDDPSRADDVVQDTWLSALKHPPERRRALRPWLAKVARNVARMQRRSESSRKLRESTRGDERELASPAELAACLEGQRLLVEALGRLAEPYRSTILLAYFERATSDEIARRQGVAAGTVRWRIKVGIDALREELDQKHQGDSRAWSVALLPLVRTDSKLVAIAASATLPWQGVLIVQSWLKISAALAAVALLLGALTFSGIAPWPSPWRASEPPLAVTFAPIETSQPSGAIAEVAASGSRSALSSSAPAIGEEAALVAPRTGVIAARFLARDGRPLQGVVMRTRYGERPAPEAALSDVDGRALLELAIEAEARDVRFEATSRSFATRVLEAHVEAGGTVDLGEIVLEPGGNVAGRVVDVATRPLEGVEITLSDVEAPQSELERQRRSPLRSYERPSTFTAHDGTFVLEGAPVGFERLAAGADGWLVTFSAPIEVREGQVSSGVELVLEALGAEDVIEGVVIDPSGREVPWAHIEYRDASQGRGTSGTLNTDEHGRFRVMLFERNAHHLRAYDREEKYSGAALDDVEPGTRDVVLRLLERATLEVLVRTVSGEPIQSYTARALDPDAASYGASTGTGPHAQGRSKLSPPTQRFVVDVDAPGFDTARAGPFDGRATSPLVFELSPIPTVRGRVSARGQPIHGARIIAFARGEGRHEKNGFRVVYDPEPLSRIESSPNGEFVLTLRKSGDFVVRVESDGLAPAEIDLARYDHDVGRADLEVELTQGGAIEGRVIMPGGREPAGTLVAFSRGDGFAFTQRVGADGMFRAERLTPGRFEVRHAEREIHAERGGRRSWPRGGWDEIPSNCEVVDGQITRFDLVLEGASEPATLSGRLTVDGAPPGPWSAVLWAGSLGAKSQGSTSASLDPDGRFDLAAHKPGEGHLVLTAVSGALDGLRVVVPVSLAPGRSEWSQDLRTAEIALSNVRIDAGREVDLCLVSIGAGGMFALRPVRASGESRLALPAGRVKLARVDEQGLAVDPRQWRALAEVVVEPGGSAALSMP